MDWPPYFVVPNGICIATSDFTCEAGIVALCTNGTFASAIWTTANTALYIPFQLEIPMIVQRMGIHVGTQSGNLDIGIMDEKGNAVVTKGSTAVAVAGLQTFDMTATISHGVVSPVLMPGTYFYAMNCDNITAAFYRTTTNASTCRACGIQQQAVGAVALPATATFANPASGYVPLIAISGVAVM